MLELDPTTSSTNRSSCSQMLRQQNSQENTCDGILYSLKGRLHVCSFTKKGTPSGVTSCKFSEIILKFSVNTCGRVALESGPNTFSKIFGQSIMKPLKLLLSNFHLNGDCENQWIINILMNKNVSLD